MSEHRLIYEKLPERFTSSEAEASEPSDTQQDLEKLKQDIFHPPDGPEPGTFLFASQEELQMWISQGGKLSEYAVKDILYDMEEEDEKYKVLPDGSVQTTKFYPTKESLKRHRFHRIANMDRAQVEKMLPILYQDRERMEQNIASDDELTGYMDQVFTRLETWRELRELQEDPNATVLEVPKGKTLALKFETYVNWQYFRPNTTKMGGGENNDFVVQRHATHPNWVIIRTPLTFSYGVEGGTVLGGTARGQRRTARRQRNARERRRERRREDVLDTVDGLKEIWSPVVRAEVFRRLESVGLINDFKLTESDFEHFPTSEGDQNYMTDFIAAVQGTADAAETRSVQEQEELDSILPVIAAYEKRLEQLDTQG